MFYDDAMNPSQLKAYHDSYKKMGYDILRLFEKRFPDIWERRKFVEIIAPNAIVLTDVSNIVVHFSVGEYTDDDHFKYEFWTNFKPQKSYMNPLNRVHVFLIGRQGSGKTTLSYELYDRGFDQIQEYTTRPKRIGESDDEYQFVTNDEFRSYTDNGSISYISSYPTKFGEWKYGLSSSEFTGNYDTVTVIDPQGYLQMKQNVHGCFGVFMDIPKDIRIPRLIIRGDDPDEIKRREKADDIDFEYLEHHFKEVCNMRIGRQRSVAQDADRIIKHVNYFRKLMVEELGE